jgi:hypothetical protein
VVQANGAHAQPHFVRSGRRRSVAIHQRDLTVAKKLECSDQSHENKVLKGCSAAQ